MRSNYLLLKQARIVAMTCTHAAITRRQLVELGFRYDNLVMEEAAQVIDSQSREFDDRWIFFSIG
jgi:intron-binding protein aquarius